MREISKKTVVFLCIFECSNQSAQITQNIQNIQNTQNIQITQNTQSYYQPKEGCRGMNLAAFLRVS